MRLKLDAGGLTLLLYGYIHQTPVPYHLVVPSMPHYRTSNQGVAAVFNPPQADIHLPYHQLPVNALTPPTHHPNSNATPTTMPPQPPYPNPALRVPPYPRVSPQPAHPDHHAIPTTTPPQPSHPTPPLHPPLHPTLPHPSHAPSPTILLPPHPHHLYLPPGWAPLPPPSSPGRTGPHKQEVLRL